MSRARVDGLLPATTDELLPADELPEGGRLLLEVDGPDVHPHTVDAVTLLDMASAFFSLVAAEATRIGGELNLAGITIEDKCIQIGTQASSRRLAAVCTERTSRVLAGTMSAPPKASVQVQRFKKAAQNLSGSGHRIIAMGTNSVDTAADWTLPLALAKPQGERPLDSLETFRARPVRVGGTTPAVRFESVLEREEFTLDVTKDQARALGAHLYREVEVEAKIERGRDGNIIGGRLLSVEPVDVECDDPWGAWERWYRETGREDGT